MSVKHALVIVACLLCRPEADAGVLRDAGRNFGAGAVESIQPVLVSTLADAEARATRLEDHVGVVAGGLIDQVDAKGQARLSQVDHILEARLLQVQVAGKDVADHTLAGVDQLIDNSLARAQKLEKTVVQDLQAVTASTIQQASDALATRITDVRRAVDGAIAKADRTLAERIAQVDEVVGRRLGNVDVIASKQRIAIEETAIRVAVMIGLVVFTVFMLRRLYARYGTLRDRHGTDHWSVRGGLRTVMFARGLGVPLLGHLVVAVLGAGVLLVLYDRLPFGARAEADQLVAVHRNGFADSLARFDFARARFHASQLEYLAPEDAGTHGALLAKAELVRDVFERPTLMATSVGVTELWQRLEQTRRLMGAIPDPDLLVVEAMLRWETGTSRDDELRAASLCARALRVRPPVGGFTLAPLARAYIETFVDAPYRDEHEALGRDSYPLEDLRAVLEYAPPLDPAHPLAPRLAVLRLMRTLDARSSTAYVTMVQAHVAVIAAGKAKAPAAQAERTKAAQAVLQAWRDFDDALAASPALARDPSVLRVFRLDDAQYVRAKWFVLHPETRDLAPLVGAAAALPDRLAMAPPRLVWARRYQALLDGPARALFELQEANRFAAMERAADAFERAMLAMLAPAKPAAPRPSALSADEQAKARAAEAAAALGLYITTSPAPSSREPFADRLAPARLAADPAAYARLVDGKRARGLRLL